MKTNKTKYTLGIDLGVNSIGWAVLRNNPNKGIDKCGALTFKPGKDNVGLAKESSTNADRRASRLIRRQYFRRRLRKQHLLSLLIQFEMCPLSIDELNKWKKWNPENKEKKRGDFPSSARFKEWLRLNPYQLRSLAVSEVLQDDEIFSAREKLGRICYAMIQRRGFQSSRKVKEEGALYDGSKDGHMIGVATTLEGMDKSDKTLGAYLYQIGTKEGEKYSSKREKMRGRYTLRSMYIEEFHAIWSKQAEALGLKDKVVTIEHRRHFVSQGIDNGGTISLNKNQEKKLATYRAKDPKVKVIRDREGLCYFQYHTTKPLLEHLAGKIGEIGASGKPIYYTNESVLFWQRPLRSQKGLVDRCSFEGRRFYVEGKDGNAGYWANTGPKVIPASHPKYELYRAMQQIHNLRIDGVSLDQMHQLIVLQLLLESKGQVKIEKIKKKLGLNGRYNYSDDDTFVGCPTIHSISTLLRKQHKPNGSNVSGTIDPAFSIDLYSSIWHKIYTHDSNELLVKNLLKLGDDLFVDDLYEKVSKVNLEEGYGNVSQHAIDNILHYMLRGEELYHAILLGGIRNAIPNKEVADMYETELKKFIHSLDSVTKTRGETVDAIIAELQSSKWEARIGQVSEIRLRNKLYHPTQATSKATKQSLLPEVENLRNPLVEQALWALRRLVNTLLKESRDKIDSNFEFDEIHIELTRDLKATVTQRKEMRSRQNLSAEENNEARQILRAMGLRPDRNNLHKYKLYLELQEQNYGVTICPYSGQQIQGIGDALSELGTFQIEHIVPRSIYNDDSLANKTLCLASFNRLKGNRTPYQFYQSNPDPNLWGADSWEAVKQRAFKLLPYRKAKRFVLESIPEEMTNEALTNTGYITKKAKEYLELLSPPNGVRVVSGSLTAELRKLWGLNDILANIMPLDASAILDGLEDRTAVWANVDKETQKILQLTPMNTPLPQRQDGDILTTLIYRDKDKTLCHRHNAVITSVPKGIKLKDKASYYLHLKEPKVVMTTEMFSPRPEGNEEKIVVKATRKGSNLTCEQLDLSFLDKSMYSTLPQGNYWVEIPLRERPIIQVGTSKGNRQKEIRTIVGTIRKGQFTSGSYRRSAGGYNDGSAYVEIEPNLDEITFTKVKLDPPVLKEKQALFTGSFNNGYLVIDEDRGFNMPMLDNSRNSHIKRYVVIEFKEFTLTPLLADQPTKKRGELQFEGEYIFNPKSNRGYFSPAKNRDDHRHHALDAIVIAAATQGMTTALSTYNANMDNYHRNLANKRPAFDLPWEGFRDEVKKHIESVLISHPKPAKVVTKIRKKIRKEGRTFISEGLAIKGQLHKESGHGYRRSPETGVKSYHRRVPIQEVTSKAHLLSVVDPAIRKIMIKHLEKEFGFKINSNEKELPKNAFYSKEGEYLIHLPNRKGGEPVPVKKVRLSNNSATMIAPHAFNKYFEPRNNHHVVIYYDQDGNAQESIVTLMEVAQRVKNGEVLIQLPRGGSEIITVLQRNNMYLIGITRKEAEDNINNPALLSKYLYRVQKLSSVDYTFRLHTASTIDNSNEMIRVTSLTFFKGEESLLKVKISITGKISFDDDFL